MTKETKKFHAFSIGEYINKTQIVMKTKFLLSICCIVTINLNAQISTIDVAEQHDPMSDFLNPTSYNPRWNYPFGDKYELLIGEELYVLPLPPNSTIYNQALEKDTKDLKQ